MQQSRVRLRRQLPGQAIEPGKKCQQIRLRPGRRHGFDGQVQFHQRLQILEMNGEIKIQQQIAMDLSNQIYTLTYDPKTVERLAREKLGYARPDETVIHFEPASSTATTR
jgi:hypothetical protein